MSSIVDNDNDDVSAAVVTIFDSFGILEHILSYVNTPNDLLCCCLVNKRWKEAGRNDELWQSAIPRLWQSKIGVGNTTINTTTTTATTAVTTSTSTIAAAAANNNNNNVLSSSSLIYWRSLYTKDALNRMSIEQIKSIFNHPLLTEKKELLMRNWNTANTASSTTQENEETTKRKKAELQRFLRVHMLDIMSDIAATETTTTTTPSSSRIAGRATATTLIQPGTTRTTTRTTTTSLLDLDHEQSLSSTTSSDDATSSDTSTGLYHFFNDIYFGSYVCSILDSKRNIITKTELCTKHGFDMYFKIAEEEVDDADRTFLTRYDMDHGNNNHSTTTATTEESESEESSSSSSTTTTNNGGILLYHHSTCYFKESNRDFQIVLKENNNLTAHTYHPTDLKWRWLEVGKRLQVGPYPSLLANRIKHNWGWKLENQHVVLLFRDHS